MVTKTACPKLQNKDSNINLKRLKFDPIWNKDWKLKSKFKGYLMKPKSH
jgi:hypothetical protein